MLFVETTRALTRYWMVVINLALLGVIVGAAATVLLPRTYEANATVFISAAQPVGKESLVSSSQFALAQVPSYTELVQSDSVLAPTIAELQLETTSTALRHRVSVTNPPDTVLLVVHSFDHDPAVATRVANTIAWHLGTAVEATTSPPGVLRASIAIPAETPTTPEGPSLTTLIMVGMLLGLVLGATSAVVRRSLDRSVQDRADIEEITGMMPLCMVPDNGPRSARGPLPGIPTLSMDVARAIRTALQFLEVDCDVDALVVTSAVGRESKSTTASDLARALAEVGQTTLLIDADLRRPRDHTDVHPLGLADVLAGRCALDDALEYLTLEDFHVLPAGSKVTDPGLLLSSDAMIEFLSIMRLRFDTVIIDSPPLLGATDAAVLAAATSGAVLTIRCRSTSKEQLREAQSRLEGTGARLLGTILTHVPSNSLLVRSPS